MTAFMNCHADLLGLESAATPKAFATRSPVLTWMISACLAMGVIGGLVGTYVEYKEAERVELEKQAALKEAEEKAKNRERDAQLKRMSDLGMRYQYQLEQERQRVFGAIANLESYRDTIPQVKKFLSEYQLPEDVRMAISEPVDLQSARSADTYEFQVQGVAEPKNLEQARAKWQAILSAAGRYAEGIDRNDSYFNGYLKSMNIDEQFKAEFGKRPMQQAPAAAKPQVEAVPVTPAEPVVEPVVAEPAAPVAEATPATKPAPRPAAAPKPRTVQTSDGRTQVFDWLDQ